MEQGDGDDDDDDDFIEDDSPVKKKKAKSSSSHKKIKKKKVKAEKLAAAVKKEKKRKASSDASSSPRKKKVKKEGAAGAATTRTLKKLDKTERLQYAMQSFLWWDAPEPPEGSNWVTMEHAGVSFPEAYQPHGVALLYDGQPVALTPLQEEAATFFAATDPDGMHLGNPKTAKIFIQNFFADFKAVLGKGSVIRDFKKCDFEPIRRHLNEQKIIRKAITDQERKANKEDRNQVLFQFGFALVDGHLERVGNYNMEPPGAFRGRGEHPKMGKLKSRVLPEQVSLNLSRGSARAHVQRPRPRLVRCPPRSQGTVVGDVEGEHQQSGALRVCDGWLFAFCWAMAYLLAAAQRVCARGRTKKQRTD